MCSKRENEALSSKSFGFAKTNVKYIEHQVLLLLRYNMKCNFDLQARV